MADITRQAQAIWRGELRNGSGTISSTSGFFREMPYSVPSRFEQAKGTNPEELLAKILGDQKITPQEIATKATLSLGQRGGGWKIFQIHLETEARAENMDLDTLKRAAEQAKEQCPVSMLLKPGLEAITLDVRLKNA
jgi:lipoyl-dependent peroxiredoxin